MEIVPMRINLKEVSNRGQDFSYDQKHTEMSEKLANLIGQNDYSVKFNITPLNNDYFLTGQIETVIDEVCSKCGQKMKYSIKKKLYETIINDKLMHGAKTMPEDDVDVLTVQAGQFDLGSYIYEIFALEWPNYPYCGIDKCLHQDEINETIESINNPIKEIAVDKGHPGFKSLKKLKIS